ncbi:hypothetical protein [Georgenia yuyongxinii]|uniref:Uncharacterized protein n=1 Tax=Georgenia yuyongxinii TaxID=2589797 RepID=A0A552WVS9_9MICO|nr:hypothetical protein [Georgenia yuyongxinii]TRW46403.1 hypothetical protein FJ693_05605 [Georgenia yuyongxinii]
MTKPLQVRSDRRRPTRRERWVAGAVAFTVLVVAGVLLRAVEDPFAAAGRAAAPVASSAAEAAALDLLGAAVEVAAATVGAEVVLVESAACGSDTTVDTLTACHRDDVVQVSMPADLAPHWADAMATGCPAGTTLTPHSYTEDGMATTREVLRVLCVVGDT